MLRKASEQSVTVESIICHKSVNKNFGVGSRSSVDKGRYYRGYSVDHANLVTLSRQIADLLTLLRVPTGKRRNGAKSMPVNQVVL